MESENSERNQGKMISPDEENKETYHDEMFFVRRNREIRIPYIGEDGEEYFSEEQVKEANKRYWRKKHEYFGNFLLRNLRNKGHKHDCESYICISCKEEVLFGDYENHRAICDGIPSGRNA